MTLHEYFIRIEAYQIRKVDEQENLALQAWMNQAVQATTGSSKHPRPKYKKFGDFYNLNYMENEVHKSFNPDYIPPVQTKEERERNEQEIIFERYQKLQKFRAAQRKKKKKDKESG